MEVGIFNKDIKISKYMYHMLHGGSCFKKVKIVSKDGNHRTFTVFGEEVKGVYIHIAVQTEKLREQRLKELKNIWLGMSVKKLSKLLFFYG